MSGAAAPTPGRARAPKDSIVVLTMDGEGIGKEIVREGTRVLEAAAAACGFGLEIVPCVVGLDAVAASGTPWPADVEKLCDAHAERGTGAILFGAVSDEPIGILRHRYDLFLNLRPARAWPGLARTTPLRPELVAGLDVLVVRELVGGIYYGDAREGGTREAADRWASQDLHYTERQVVRVVRAAFDLAASRRKKLTYVHKGNVIKGVFALWGDVVASEAKAHPGIELEDLLVDNCAMQLVRRPAEFDVVLAENMFGDILSDLLAGITGSIGVLPSASLNERGFGLYESIGGTAPDIAGKGVANPVSTILSAAMLCEHSLGRPDARARIEAAVDRVLAEMRTPDIREEGLRVVSTEELGRAVAAAVTG